MEIHVYGGKVILVTTGDVLSFASVHPDSFQLSPHVRVFGRHSVNCARVVRHIRCLFFRSLVVASAYLVRKTVCS